MKEKFKHFFNSNNRPKILVVGDLILDEYIWGGVNRISPEAPVPILETRSENLALGGAANVANNLVALGCEVHLCGAIGVPLDRMKKAINFYKPSMTGLFKPKEFFGSFTAPQLPK